LIQQIDPIRILNSLAINKIEKQILI
jgi:hypothetical protein